MPTFDEWYVGKILCHYILMEIIFSDPIFLQYNAFIGGYGGVSFSLLIL